MLTVCPGLYDIDRVSVMYMGQRQESISIKLPKTKDSTKQAEVESLVTFRGKMCKITPSACDDKSLFAHAVGSTKMLFDRKKAFRDALIGMVNQERQVCFLLLKNLTKRNSHWRKKTQVQNPLHEDSFWTMFQISRQLHCLYLKKGWSRLL